MAHGIFLDQGSNWSPLHQQADSYPLRHEGSPEDELFSSHLCQQDLGTGGSWTTSDPS